MQKEAQKKIAPLKFLCAVKIKNNVEDIRILKHALGSDLYEYIQEIDSNITATHSLDVSIVVKRITDVESRVQKNGEIYRMGSNTSIRIIPIHQSKRQPKQFFTSLDIFDDKIKSISVNIGNNKKITIA